MAKTVVGSYGGTAALPNKVTVYSDGSTSSSGSSNSSGGSTTNKPSSGGGGGSSSGKAVKDMTVAEAAAAGKTAEYNQLVSGYFPGGVVAPLNAGGGQTYSQLAGNTSVTALGNTPPVVVPEEKKPPVPPVTKIPTVTTTNEDTTAKDNLTAVTDEIKKLYEDKPSQEQAYYDAEIKAGLEAKRQEVQNYSDQQNVIIAERDAAIQQIRNQSSTEGGTVGILSAREDALNRSANIKLLPIQAKLAAAQDNLELAQDRLNTIFDLKVKDAENEFNRDMKILEVSYDYMTKEQQNKADEIKQDKQNSFTLFNNKVNAIQSMANDALKNNPTLSAMLMEYAGGLNQNTIATTDTNSELARIMKNYGGTSSGTEIDRVIDINGVQTPVDKYGNVINIKGGTQTTTTTNSTAQLDLMTKTLENVFGATYDPKTGEFTPTKDKDALYKVSGQSPITRTIGSWGGVTQFQQLQNYANTLKTNMLTLATDPSIKKFFGPQMSNADVKLMMSGGTTLDPESQTPAQFKEEALRVADFIARANKAVTTGMQKETAMKSVEQPQTMTVGSVTYKLGADGLYYTQ